MGKIRTIIHPKLGEVIVTLTDRLLPDWYMNEAVETETIEHIADLARIDLSEAEQTALAADFADILEYFETLEAVPETESEPELVNVMRDDEIQGSLDQAAALRNAPETEDGYIKGPPVG